MDALARVGAERTWSERPAPSPKSAKGSVRGDSSELAWALRPYESKRFADALVLLAPDPAEPR